MSNCATDFFFFGSCSLHFELSEVSRSLSAGVFRARFAGKSTGGCSRPRCLIGFDCLCLLPSLLRVCLSCMPACNGSNVVAWVMPTCSNGNGNESDHRGLMRTAWSATVGIADIALTDNAAHEFAASADKVWDNQIETTSLMFTPISASAQSGYCTASLLAQ